MGLYFLIAGYFVPRSYDHHGFGGFVRIKSLHLGVPLVVLTALCSVMTGRLEIGHLWFVEHLLVYSLLYALFRLAAPRPGHIRVRLRVAGVFACALAVSVATFWVRRAYPVNEWVMAGAFLRMEPVPMGGGTGKFLFIWVASTILSYGAACVLRRIPVVRRIV